MKPGDKIPIVLEVVEIAKDGEEVTQNGETFTLNNMRGNKWWAVPVGHKTPRILICSDFDTEASMIKRKAIVDLLECGVGV